MTRSVPERSCLGCRATKAKGELLRFVLSPERHVIPDPQNKLPGRGAYTCWQRECLILALNKRQFARSFKGEVFAGGPQDLLERVMAGLEERVASYLSLANKAGKAVSGSDMVLESLRKGAPGLLLLATDISSDSADRFRAVAAKSGIPVYTMFTKDRLGGLLGKELRSAVAIIKSGFVDQLTTDLERFGNFFEGGAE
ncbi:MAG TPA: DUF448 domain-containing protein [Geobacteraceae bacterium]